MYRGRSHLIPPPPPTCHWSIWPADPRQILNSLAGYLGHFGQIPTDTCWLYKSFSRTLKLCPGIWEYICSTGNNLFIRLWWSCPTFTYTLHYIHKHIHSHVHYHTCFFWFRVSYMKILFVDSFLRLPCGHILPDSKTTWRFDHISITNLIFACHYNLL